MKFSISSIILLILLPVFSTAQVYLLKDMNPGIGDGMATYATDDLLLVAGDKMYFQGYTDDLGREPWVTDGTEAGTYLIKDINEGVQSSHANLFIEYNDLIYFVATNYDNGFELWRTDGTEAGTWMVKDIYEGIQNGVDLGADLYVYNGLLYFSATDLDHGTEIWKSDGTESGTELAIELSVGPTSSEIENFTVWQDWLYFAGEEADSGFGQELYKSDGTQANTQLVKDLNPGAGSSNVDRLFPTTNLLYFAANNGSDGQELWTSDGTESGTSMVTDLYPGLGGAFPGGVFTEMIEYNGALLFEADGSFFLKQSIYFTDGTEAGTVLVKESNTDPNGYTRPEHFTEYEGMVYFLGFDDDLGNGLWKTDGTAAGTEIVKDFGYLDQYPRPYMDATPDALFLSGNLDVENGTNSELFISDGTSTGTVLLAEINPGEAGSDPYYFIPFDEKIFFTAIEENTGRELYIFDANPEPLVLDLSQTADVLCFGDSTAALSLNIEGGIPPFYLDWEPAFVTGSNPDGLPAGEYEVHVTDGFGGDLSIGISIAQPDELLADVVATPDDGSGNGMIMVEVSGGVPPYSYSWNTDPIQIGEVAVDLPFGEYEVVITDANGCTLIKEAKVELMSPTSEPYPEESRIYLRQSLPETPDLSLLSDAPLAAPLAWRIINLQGQVLRSGSLQPGQQQWDLDVSSLTAGMYLIQLEGNRENPLVFRFMKL
ncbi:MAG: T9SS type A sorting domain-containing protein [Bacteroidetes bacterium]|nr:T9SS type A sorting domain-containing protein [Bacteroidota bacterium]